MSGTVLPQTLALPRPCPGPGLSPGAGLSSVRFFFRRLRKKLSLSDGAPTGPGERGRQIFFIAGGAGEELRQIFLAREKKLSLSRREKISRTEPWH